MISQRRSECSGRSCTRRNRRRRSTASRKKTTLKAALQGVRACVSHRGGRGCRGGLSEHGERSRGRLWLRWCSSAATPALGAGERKGAEGREPRGGVREVRGVQASRWRRLGASRGSQAGWEGGGGRGACVRASGTRRPPGRGGRRQGRSPLWAGPEQELGRRSCS